MTTEIPKILFLCIGNTCRSIMAQYTAKVLLPEPFKIESAGISANGSNINPHAIRLINQKYAFDISEQKSVHIQEKNLSEYTYIISLDTSVTEELKKNNIKAEKIFQMHMEDPVGKDYDTYLKTHAIIENNLKEFMRMERLK